MSSTTFIDSPDNPQRWANIFNNQFSLQMRKPEGACPRLRGRERGGSSDFSLVVLGKWVRGSAQVYSPRSHRRLWGRWVQSRGSLCPALPHGETLESPEEELGVSSHLLCFLIILFPLKNWRERDFPGGPVVKSLPASAGDTGLIPGLGRSHVSRST